MWGTCVSFLASVEDSYLLVLALGEETAIWLFVRMAFVGFNMRNAISSPSETLQKIFWGTQVI